MKRLTDEDIRGLLDKTIDVSVYGLFEYVDEMAADLLRCRKALGFYANRKNWKTTIELGTTDINLDEGAIAEEALGEEK